MKEMRQKLETDNLKQGLRDSLETPIDLLSSQMKRLSLKDVPFQTFQPAEERQIDGLWEKCLQVCCLYQLLQV